MVLRSIVIESDFQCSVHLYGSLRVIIWVEQLNFCLHRCIRELPDQHIAKCILPPELFSNILIISTLCSHDISKVTKLESKFISEPDSCGVQTLWLPWSDQHKYCFHCVVYNVMKSSFAWHTSNSVWRAIILGASNTISSA